MKCIKQASSRRDGKRTVIYQIIGHLKKLMTQRKRMQKKKVKQSESPKQKLKLQRQIQINKPCGCVILSSEDDGDTMEYLIKEALKIIEVLNAETTSTHN